MSLLNIKSFLKTIGFQFVYVYQYFALQEEELADSIEKLCHDNERALAKQIRRKMGDLDLNSYHTLAKTARTVQASATKRAVANSLQPNIYPADPPSNSDYHALVRKYENLQQEHDHTEAECRFLRDELNLLTRDKKQLEIEKRDLEVLVNQLRSSARQTAVARNLLRERDWNAAGYGLVADVE
jgi:chromosome segregation ATPase